MTSGFCTAHQERAEDKAPRPSPADRGWKNNEPTALGEDGKKKLPAVEFGRGTVKHSVGWKHLDAITDRLLRPRESEWLLSKLVVSTAHVRDIQGFRAGCDMGEVWSRAPASRLSWTSFVSDHDIHARIASSRWRTTPRRATTWSRQHACMEQTLSRLRINVNVFRENDSDGRLYPSPRGVVLIWGG